MKSTKTIQSNVELKFVFFFAYNFGYYIISKTKKKKN